MHEFGWMFWPLLAFIVIGIPTYFQHREKMVKLKKDAPARPNAELLARIKALEQKCEQLQEQVNEAHFLIHDETRQLDRKLAERLGEGGSVAPENAEQGRRGRVAGEKTIG